MTDEGSEYPSSARKEESRVRSILKQSLFPTTKSEQGPKASRRAILSTFGAGFVTTGLGALSSRTPPHIRSFEDNLYYIQDLEWENIEFWNNMIELLWGAYSTDWGYRSEDSFSDVDDTLSYLETGGKEGALNAFQGICPDEYVLSSIEDDNRFGLTSRGRLASMNDGLTHQIPYKVTNKNEFLKGALPREGGFFGISIGDEVYWLFDGFQVTSRAVTDYGITELEYQHNSLNLRIKQTAYVPIGSETLRLDFDVVNECDRPLSGNFIYYLQANANTNNQSSIVFHTDVNRAEGGDVVSWQSSSEDEKSLHLQLVDNTGTPADASGVARAPINDRMRHAVREYIEQVTTKRLTRYWLWPYFEAGIKEETEEFPEGVSFKDILNTTAETTKGRYLSGYHSSQFELAPGSSTSFTVAVSDDKDAVQEISRMDTLEQETRDAWNSWIDSLNFDDIDHELREFSKFQATVLAINWVPSADSFVAAHHLQPNYYYVWPRDGIDTAIAAARIGLEDEARRFLTKFLPAIQEPNGILKQAYMTDGTAVNMYLVGHDQAAKFITGSFELERIVEDDLVGELKSELLAAAESFAHSIASNGLLRPAYDYKETPNQISQSIYTNALAVRALEELQTRFDVDYSNQIETIREGIENELLRPKEDEWFRALEGVVPSWRSDYTGMSSYLYTLSIIDDTTYLEEMIQTLGIENVNGNWTVATNHIAESLARNSTEVFEIGTERYSGKELAFQRLKANKEHASSHRILYEKLNKKGEPLDARYLTWSAAEFLNAAKILAKTES